MALNGGRGLALITNLALITAPALSALFETISSATLLGKICRVGTEPKPF
jgi:hypothetical protein